MGIYMERRRVIQAAQYLPITGEIGDAAALADWIDNVITPTWGGDLAVDETATDDHGFRVTWTDGQPYSFEGKPGHWILDSFPPEFLTDTEFRRRWELPRV
jgi:hypothetical protein